MERTVPTRDASGSRPGRSWMFAVSSPRLRSRDEWRAFAKRAEDLDYDIVYLADHTTYVDPLLPLVTMADATTRLRLGTLVLNVGFWHPLLLARAAATLQLLTDDRFELGLGAGWAKPEHDELALPFGSGGDRVTLLLDTLRLVHAGLRGDEIVPTDRFPVSATATPPAPLDVPPTILVGGFGERLLRGCAPLADVIQLAGVVPDGTGGLTIADAGTDAFRRRVGWVRDAAGERFADIRLAMMAQRVVVVAADDTEARLAACAAELSMTPAQAADTPLILVGTPDQIAGKLLRLRAELGIDHVTVFAPVLEDFAPVIARLRAEERRGSP